MCVILQKTLYMGKGGEAVTLVNCPYNLGGYKTQDLKFYVYLPFLEGTPLNLNILLDLKPHHTLPFYFKSFRRVRSAGEEKIKIVT